MLQHGKAYAILPLSMIIHFFAHFNL